MTSTTRPKSHLQSWTRHGGIRLAGQVWGEPGRPTVVLLHGGGQTRHAWKGVGDALAMQGYRVVALDARGHGDSDWAKDGDYSLDAMVGDLRCVVDTLGTGPIALVGASMGGLTSMVGVGEGRLAASALLLVDVAPTVNPEGRQRILDFMAHKPEGFDTLQEVADLISAYQPQRPRPATTAGLSKNLRVTAAGKYRWHWDPAFHMGASSWHDRDGRLTAAARHLRLPVLLVRGQLSDVLTDETAAEFLRLCPQAEYVVVRSAGHMVAGDRNDVFGSALVDFLGRHLPPARLSARG
jgi:non-heme chloroperoxidase